MGDADNNNRYKVKLYIRFPHKIEDKSDVKSLHPGIKAVFFSRQKSRNWCVVTFDSPEVTTEARKFLKKTKVNDKKLVVTPFTKARWRTERVIKACEKKRVLRLARRRDRKALKKEAQAIKTDQLVDLLKKEEKP